MEKINIIIDQRMIIIIITILIFRKPQTNTKIYQLTENIIISDSPLFSLIKNIVFHSKNLEYYLKKAYFKQIDYMEENNELNANMRAKSKSNFEKEFCKL